MSSITHAENHAVTDEVGTPQYEFTKREQEIREKRKAQISVVKEWVEISPDKKHAKGGKVLLCTKLSNGNTHRVYVGREKASQTYLAEMKAKGKLA